MERTHRAHVLRLAIAAGLGLCLSLPLAAQEMDMTKGSHVGTRATKAAAAASSRASDQRFLDKATKDNEKEVAAATVGQQKASSPDVRTYAEHLLRDHQDMLVKLDETAVALGVSSTRRYTAMAGWGNGKVESGDTLQANGAIGSTEPAPTGAGGTSTSGSVTGKATGTSATTTASASGGTGYDTTTMASTDANRASTGMTAQAVPESASNDPALKKMAGLSGGNFDRAFVDHMVVDHKKAIAEFERASKDSTLSAETRELASNALPKLRNHLAMAETLRVNLKTSAN